MIMTIKVLKECPVEGYVDHPVTNNIGEKIGVITEALDLGEYVELTMDVKIPEPISRPLTTGFSIRSR